MEQLEYDITSSPLGDILIGVRNDLIVLVEFIDDKDIPHGKKNPENELIINCKTQLNEYFTGMRKSFNLPLFYDGTKLQVKAWNFLKTIPYGKTASYQDEARAVGNVKAVRAVGGANGKNYISIIVPCHRVIGKNGKLTGYGGGLWRKEWLLRHENAVFKAE